MNGMAEGMNPQTDFPPMLLDKPLLGSEVLKDDKLGRAPFARTVTKVLERVSGASGLVVSIEGAWGSGKTTTLSIVEALLQGEPAEVRPVIVHFNPWLVGDRDALLRQFLSKVASEVKLGDPSKDGKRVAKELKTYAKAFDVLKLIPGAEPWASIVKSVVDSMGDAVGSVADYKTPDIEVRKQAVAERLSKFSRRIIVFVDDIDRLFPLEVFEMVRIIKAVGDLPNVGYVVAWDPKYVREALSSANVPVAGTYLDKIVQVRMPLPALSSSARTRLINDAIESLPQEALKEHFQNNADRLSLVYYRGLRDLLEQPRDVLRAFAAVRTVEPSLRGEVALSDIIGLCALMVTASEVFELLKNQPEIFVGNKIGVRLQLKKRESLIAAGNDARNQAIAACRSPSAVRELVQFLFPLVAEAEGETPWPTRFRDGHLSNPDRLAVALQHSTS
jgi:predicted KAP-like P-loop ATPase